MMKKDNIRLAALAALILMCGLVSAQGTPLTYGLATPCNLNFQVNATPSEFDSSYNDSYYPPACWNVIDSLCDDVNCWWDGGGGPWSDRVWIGCNAARTSCSIVQSQHQTDDAIASANFSLPAGVVSYNMTHSIDAPGGSGTCRLHLYQYPSGTCAETAGCGGSHGAGTSNRAINVAAGTNVRWLSADTGDFGCGYSDFMLLDSGGEEWYAPSQLTSVTPHQYSSVGGFPGGFTVDVDAFQIGGTGGVVANVWTLKDGDSVWKCDPDSFDVVNQYDSISLDSLKAGNEYDTDAYEVNTSYTFKITYYENNTFGLVDAQQCDGDAESSYWLSESSTGTASTYECYDQGETPYSEDCEEAFGTQDYLCIATGDCEQDLSTFACGGKGQEADCVGQVVDGTTCDMANCWCDWLSWQSPICALKVAGGEDCYHGFGCTSGFCTGEDQGIACNCGNEGCDDTNYDCLYGNSAGPASDSCWLEGVCAAEGGAATDMYLTLDDNLVASDEIYLEWTPSVESPFGFYVVQVWTEYPESVSEYVTEDCDEDASIMAINTISENYTTLSPPCQKGGTNTYRVVEWDASFDPINWTDTKSVDVPNCYDNDDCEFGTYCGAEGICTISGTCEEDADCPTYCLNPYPWVWEDEGRHKTCSEYYQATGLKCNRDEQCSSGTCTNPVVHGDCTYPEMWCGDDNTGLCYSDDVCRTQGVCTSGSNTCTFTTDCDTLYSNYDYWCSSGQCIPDSLDGGDCSVGGDSSCLGHEIGNYHCIADQCVPIDWECNYRLEGCSGDEYCYGDPADTPGGDINLVYDHSCAACEEMGSECSSNFDCCYPAGQCMGGLCVPGDWGCEANNPNSNNQRVSSGADNRYCDGDFEHYNQKWCYTDPLSNGLPPGVVSAPDNHCYFRYDGGIGCDYDYQCQSWDCDISSHTCTGDSPIPPDPIIPRPPHFGDAGVEIFFGSITNPLTEFRVGEQAKLFAKYINPDGELYVGSAVECVWAGTGFLAPQGYRLYTGPSYYQRTIKAHTTGHHKIEMTCYTGDSCSVIDPDVCVSNELWVDINSETWTYIDCGTRCPSCSCPSSGTNYEAESDDFSLKLVHKKGNEVTLRGSTCTLTIDYDDDDAKQEYDVPRRVNEQYYEVTGITVPALSTSTSGDSHKYDIVCDDGVNNPARYASSFMVVGDTCDNNEWDENEDGVDCGGPCPDECEEDCFNDVKDGDETDVDCGGRDCKKCRTDDDDCEPDNNCDCDRDRDCRSGFCRGYNADRCSDDFDDYDYECREPRCNDDCWNGDEDGIDCGGDCDPCGCAGNTDCKDDGSEHCEISDSIFGTCEDDTCVGDSDCPPLEWGDSFRQRFCNTDVSPAVCKFGSNNGHDPDAPDMIVYPVSGASYVNDDETVINVHVCDEDGDRGYRVQTNIDTIKHYIINEIELTPSIPAKNDEYYIFGGEETYEKVTTDNLDDICNLPSGQDLAWHSVTLFASPKSTVGSSWMSEVLYGVSLREPFTVEVNRYLGNTAAKVFEFNLTRDGFCNYSQQTWEEKTTINTVASDYILLNYDETPGAKPIPVFRYRCVSIYGEVVEGTYTQDPLDFLEFQTWMIYLIVFIFAIPVPLIVLLILRWNGRGPRNDGT